MGILDNVKKGLGFSPAKDQDQDQDLDQQYSDEYLYDDGEDNSYYDEQDLPARSNSRRSGYAIDDHPPLISMTDVRSQELPPLDSQRPSTGSSPRGSYQKSINEIPQSTNFPVYEIADDTPDPLLQRHSLSNTGNFDSTSPAYYASRSGVGKVRSQGGSGSGGSGRPRDFRETVVIRPENYASAEEIAINLRQGNAVAVVLTNTRPELAKRILDFAFGAAAALEGQVDSPANRIYIFTLNYGLTSQELELLQARGIL